MTNQGQEGRMHCKKCQAVLGAGARFCSDCGEPVESKTACKNCGTEHQGKFCPNCGTPASVEREEAAQKMLTREEQEKLISKVKQLPAIKRMRTLEIVFDVLSYPFLIFGIGIGFWVASMVIGRKRRDRIDQELAIEVRKLQMERAAQETTAQGAVSDEGTELAQDDFFGVMSTPLQTENRGSVPSVQTTVIEKKQAPAKEENQTAEELRGKVDRMVCVARTYHKMEFFIYLIAAVSWLLLLLVNVCSDIFGLTGFNGIDIIKIMCEEYKEYSNVSPMDPSYQDSMDPMWGILMTVFFFFMGLTMVIATIVTGIKNLVTSRGEIAIRESKGEVQVPLTVKEIRGCKAGSQGAGLIFITIFHWILILPLPIWFVVDNYPFVGINYFVAFLIGLLFIGNLVLAIITNVYMQKNKEDWGTIYGIEKSYRRYKIHKLRQSYNQ